MSEAPHPVVSTGTTEGLIEVRFRWKGVWRSGFLDAESPATYGNRITGKLRIMAACYLVLRDGNRCTIRSPFCSQGEAAFEHPESADFDHIQIREPPDDRLKNLRLACHSCNSHMQKLQWKEARAAATIQMGEREQTGATDTEIPTTVRINMGNRPLYEKWLSDNAPMSVYDAIYVGARYLQEKNGNGSPQACRNYLKTKTAGANAPFIIEESRVRKA